jgi:hypothetical protein
MHPLVIALIVLGVVAELAIFAGVIAALASQPTIFSLMLTHLWMLALLLGLLNVQLAIVAVRTLRGGGATRIDDDGVTNVKDGIGPIPWRDIRGAAIRELPPVHRLGSRRGLFVDVGTPAGGTKSIAILSSPPHQRAALERLLAEIQRRSGIAPHAAAGQTPGRSEAGPR